MRLRHASAPRPSTAATESCPTCSGSPWPRSAGHRSTSPRPTAAPSCPYPSGRRPGMPPRRAEAAWRDLFGAGRQPSAGRALLQPRRRHRPRRTGAQRPLNRITGSRPASVAQQPPRQSCSRPPVEPPPPHLARVRRAVEVNRKPTLVRRRVVPGPSRSVGDARIFRRVATAIGTARCATRARAPFPARHARDGRRGVLPLGGQVVTHKSVEVDQQSVAALVEPRQGAEAHGVPESSVVRTLPAAVSAASRRTWTVATDTRRRAPSSQDSKSNASCRVSPSSSSAPRPGTRIASWLGPASTRDTSTRHAGRAGARRDLLRGARHRPGRGARLTGTSEAQRRGSSALSNNSEANSRRVGARSPNRR